MPIEMTQKSVFHNNLRRVVRDIKYNPLYLVHIIDHIKHDFNLITLAPINYLLSLIIFTIIYVIFQSPSTLHDD